MIFPYARLPRSRRLIIMTNESNQIILGEILVMSPPQPLKPFPDNVLKINTILAYFGYHTREQIAFEIGVAPNTVTGFITGIRHSPPVAYWFEKHGIYIDRDYPDPAKALKLLDRVGA